MNISYRSGQARQMRRRPRNTSAAFSHFLSFPVFPFFLICWRTPKPCPRLYSCASLLFLHLAHLNLFLLYPISVASAVHLYCFCTLHSWTCFCCLPSLWHQLCIFAVSSPCTAEPVSALSRPCGISCAFLLYLHLAQLNLFLLSPVPVASAVHFCCFCTLHS